VLDHSHLVLVSNTADLLKAKGKSEASADSQVAVARQQVVLMGNPVFYKDLAEEEYNRYSRRAISQLPGTYDEVRALEKLIRQVPGMAFETYLLNEATEDRVKMLVNPRVFHVASHGFFWPDETNGAQERSTFSERVSNNPLLKSGILLKGAGDLMADNSLYAFNKAPGVLTAYEVMGLNLDETELVVLSACETGRGENKVGEGVYGLQRAFLVAGAKAVVMSLFKVSDEATRMLMERFYHNWLVNQMDKRAAFAQAKKELRNEYPDPIFWGAFIMVGVE
jgi:CHAT domain-containing protein